jgi:antitoxin MazE
VPIGNAPGILIPDDWLDELRVGTDVEITAENGKLVVSRVAHPREGWAEASRLLAESGEDKLLDDPCETPTLFDEHEWEWYRAIQ